MKVIFLDIDGVIATQRVKYDLDPEKMLLLKEICDKTGAKIVISSSWRRDNLEDTIKKLTTEQEEHNCPPFILPELVVGITPRHAPGFKDGFVCRGLEIHAYLKEHKGIENYLILDDDTDILLWQKDHFVKTDTYAGLSVENVRTAIDILNRNKTGKDVTKFVNVYRKKIARAPGYSKEVYFVGEYDDELEAIKNRHYDTNGGDTVEFVTTGEVKWKE